MNTTIQINDNNKKIIISTNCTTTFSSDGGFKISSLPIRSYEPVKRCINFGNQDKYTFMSTKIPPAAVPPLNNGCQDTDKTQYTNETQDTTEIDDTDGTPRKNKRPRKLPNESDQPVNNTRSSPSTPDGSYGCCKCMRFIQEQTGYDSDKFDRQYHEVPHNSTCKVRKYREDNTY